MAKTAARNIEAAERAARALELRREGRPFDEIGAELGVSAQAAHQMVSRALKALTQAPARELAALEIDRLDALTAAVMPAAMAGDLSAVDRAIRIAERRARLCGLDGRALAPPHLPPTLAAAVAARADLAGADGKPDPRREALARLDALAEVAWPFATAGDLAALSRLIDITNSRARLTGADVALPDATRPDSIAALVGVIEAARSARVGSGAGAP